ncbi:unnamed protein product [Sphagnum troendelagicum]|uniref:Uncharacterized protein n=1 Tax=Sphagnum troendelagicum TaxID=128251 RepID=A0ABP0UEK6_9BRYO
MDGAGGIPSTDFSPGADSVSRGTTGNSRRESRTNDGVMAVLSLTHMQASVASQLLTSQSVVYTSPPLGQLSVGMPSTLSTVSSQPSPTLLQHQQHQITSASSNLCHYVLVRGSRPGQERAGEGHIHTAATRTVVNLVPLQGAQSPVVGAQIAKACGSVYIQGSPQAKVLIPHFAQRPDVSSNENGLSLELQHLSMVMLVVGLQDCVIPLPKPLTVTEADKAEGQVLENGKKSHEDLPSPEVMEEHMQRIARFKP